MSNELHSFNLATLTNAELRAVSLELGLPYQLLDGLRFVERFSVHDTQLVELKQRTSASDIADVADLIERQRRGIHLL